MLSLRCALPTLPMAAALSANHLAAMLLSSSLRRLYIARDADAAGDMVQAILLDRAEAAGIEAVPRGQTEAARSLGMSHGQAMRFIIVPQAVRKVIPPLLNDFIALTKDTALVSVIGLVETVQAGRDLYSQFFNPSGYTLGAFLFLILTIPLARLVDWQIKKQNEKFQRGMP